jgi:hypothetical protein
LTTVSGVTCQKLKLSVYWVTRQPHRVARGVETLVTGSSTSNSHAGTQNRPSLTRPAGRSLWLLNAVIFDYADLCWKPVSVRCLHVQRGNTYSACPSARLIPEERIDLISIKFDVIT